MKRLSILCWEVLSMRKGKEKNGRVINPGSEAELFLEDVKAQLQYKPAAERAG